MLGPVGFFDPKMRANSPGFLPSSAGAEFEVVAGIAAGIAGALSLLWSPKMRLRIGRFFSSFVGSGIPATDGVSGSFVRDLAFGDPVSGNAGAEPPFGTGSPGRVWYVRDSPVLTSFSSER
jgi:hypothetical protein